MVSKGELLNEKYIGLKQGTYKVIDIKPSLYSGSVVWVLMCSCGRKIEVYATDFLKGIVEKCGCNGVSIEDNSDRYELLSTDNIKLNRIYRMMIKRCYDVTSKEYDRYGRKGVVVCESWRNNREEFINWAVNNGYRPWLRLRLLKGSKEFNSENCYFNDSLITSSLTNINYNYKEIEDIKGINRNEVILKLNSGEMSKDIWEKVRLEYKGMEGVNGNKRLKLRRRLNNKLRLLKQVCEDIEVISRALEVNEENCDDFTGKIEVIRSLMATAINNMEGTK